MNNTHKTINSLLKSPELAFLKAFKELALTKVAPKRKNYIVDGERISYMTKGVEEDYIKFWDIEEERRMAVSFNFDADTVALSTEVKIPINAEREFSKYKGDDYEERKNHKEISLSTENFKEMLKKYLRELRKDESLGNPYKMMSFFGIEGY